MGSNRSTGIVTTARACHWYAVMVVDGPSLGVSRKQRATGFRAGVGNTLGPVTSYFFFFRLVKQIEVTGVYIIFCVLIVLVIFFIVIIFYCGEIVLVFILCFIVRPSAVSFWEFFFVVQFRSATLFETRLPAGRRFARRSRNNKMWYYPRASEFCTYNIRVAALPRIPSRRSVGASGASKFKVRPVDGAL